MSDTSVEPPADDEAAGDDDADADDEAAGDDDADADDDAAGDDDTGADADGLGTSRDNPAPLGSAITADEWTVTVNSVTTAEADKYGQAPQAGSTILVVNVTATYNGTDSQGASAWVGVDFVTADGTTIDSLDGSSAFIPEDQFDSLTTLYEGGSVTGSKMIEVPADNWQTGVLAVTPALFSDKTFVAVR